ncbi:hypothetical protein MKW98_021113 [Papaver atlanticum]|uniref:SP-RING-type domain-containing protein n=1 Tax=Papaver atlanticum TaxID=357466 RepID=A0AAD4XU26_9MAGN|nr:hypothetical protein MKW98_021113 [Papaver atlanticum]
MDGGSTHSGGGGAGGNKTNPESSSSMDSSKVTSVAKQLSTLISTGHRFDSRQFNLCVSLARGIDYAIVNNEIPDGVDELPSLFKQVYGHNKNGILLQATNMMLMASLKSACRSGWFLAKDAEELLNFANEVSVSFCTPPVIVIEPSNPPPVISNIINRFYPWIKMTRIFASLEVKPGYGAYLLDFHVLKNEATIREKIRLFVAQTDNIDTSSCLVTPQQAIFLLNGKGIRRRIINSLDNRPQIPTNVTAMVKYGTNLLQAVGHFNGNYTIIIAFTSEASIDTPDLQHYARPLSAVNSLDSGIVKGVSRISLNCPISSRRISVPAKGRLCEHQQCFDYANYIKINSRRPSWRCPLCSQSVCYTDMYIDQQTVEVLEDVGENVVDVIISADGSWKAVRETDDPAHKQDKTLGKEGGAPNHCIGIDKNISMDTSEAEDINPLENTVHVNESMEFDITGIQNEDTFPLGFLFSNCSATSNTVTPSTRLNPCAMDPILEPSSTSFTLIRLPNDAVIPTHNRDPWDVCGTSQSSTSLSRNYPISDNLSLQSLGSSGFWDLVMNGETGRQIPRNITRTQIAVQALPDQSLLMHSRRRARPSSVDAGGAAETLQQRFSSSNMDANSASEMSPTPPGLPPMTQKWVPRSHFPGQPPVQQTVGLPAPIRFLGSYQSDVRISSSQTSEDLQNLQPSPGTRISQMASPPIMARAPPHLSRMQVRKGGSPSNVASRPKGKHSQMMSQQPSQSERFLPVVPVQLQPRRGSSSLMVGGGHKPLIGEQRERNMEAKNPDFTRVDKSSKVTPGQNWRPSGRMRGSLSGRAYSGALSQYIIQPTQVTSPSAIRDPPVNPFSTPSCSTGVAKIPSHIGDNSDRHAPTSANQPTQVDAEVCVEQENTDGVRGVKMQNHPTQVQAEKEIEDEAAEAGSCRIIDDEAERQKKKKTVAREELGLSCQSGLSTGHLNKTIDNVQQVIFIANRDGSIMSMENIIHVPKEVERILGKRTLSAIFKSKKLNAKIDVKEKNHSVKIVRERFICRACNQEGHMRTNNDCPMYGKDLDPKLKPANNSNMPSPTLVDQPMQVDAEECGEGEAGKNESKQRKIDGVGNNESKKGKTDGIGNNESKQGKIDGVRNNESKQGKTDGIGELKIQKHLTQVQADEEVENEIAEPCRMLMDDDEAERKKKKKTIAEGLVESGSSWQSGSSAEQLNKTNGNIEQLIPAAQPDSSVTSLEFISRDPKEVESVLGERTFSGNFNSKSGVKVMHSATKNVRERFVCGACGQEGHMKTNMNCPKFGQDFVCGTCGQEGHMKTSRNCPRYGEDFVCSACGEVGHMKSSKNCPRYGKDAQVESSGAERISEKRKRPNSTAPVKRNLSVN